MKPIRIMLAVFIINLLAIFTIVQILNPGVNHVLALQNVQIQQVEPVANLISGKPNRLIIPSINLRINVEDGLYNSESYEWTLSDNAAHYATITPEANNQVGNTFIYGHNTSAVFSSLENLKTGERAQVHTENDQKFTYVLRSIKEVEPTDVSLFEYQGPSILTVQTCSGSWYEKRKLFTFEFISVEAV